MKYLAPAAALVIPLASCTSTPTPTTAVGTVQDVFIGVIDTVNTLHESGRISDKDYIEVVNPLVQDGRTLVNQWHLAVKEGRQLDAATINTAIQGVIAKLRTISAEATAK